MYLSSLHDGYEEMFGGDLGNLWLAAALSDSLEVVGQGMAFSWLRWPEPPSFPPVHEQWISKNADHQLWISDLVAHPSMSGIEVGKTLRGELVGRGIAREGECVYFFRQRAGRFGSLIARG
jgi:hypothetical protein